MRIALPLLALLVIVAAAALLPIRPYLDFQVIYHANLGLLRGISLYDHAAQVNMIAQLANVSASQVFVLPFPYPPWYALSTLWLAAMPIELAARVWFALSLAMLILSTVLLTAGQPPMRRLPLSIGALFWLPVLGGLFVGQYGFPVLLGAALMTYGLRRERPILVALAAGLLTFKPHLGGLVVILAIIHLLQRRDRFGRNALLGMLMLGAIMFGVGFLASANWPLEYVGSLTGFKDVSQCHQCISLSMALAGQFGGGFEQAVWIAVFAAMSFGAWLVKRWRQVVSMPGNLVIVGLLVTLLASPYLQNYDYLLLVVPFIALLPERRSPAAWAALGLAYALPLVSLAVFGSAGNVSLVLSAGILFALAARNRVQSTEASLKSV